MVARSTTIRDKHRRTIARNKPDCGICGNPIDYTITNHLDPMAFVVDHILPLRFGGIDELFNPDGTPQKQAAHRVCNRAKSDAIPDHMKSPPREFATALTW